MPDDASTRPMAHQVTLPVRHGMTQRSDRQDKRVVILENTAGHAGGPFVHGRQRDDVPARLDERKASILRRHGITYQTLPYGGSTKEVYWKLLDLGLMSFATDHPKVTWDAVKRYYDEKQVP